MLFTPCPQRLLDNNPIKEDDYIDEGFGNRINRFKDYVSGEDWMGIAPYPRSADPEDIFDLQEKRGIRPIEVPHGMLMRKGFTVSTASMRWAADMYEYAVDLWEKELPHVIMLSRQSRIGGNNTIMHGELAQLVTAMRNRAFEPEEKRFDDDHEFEDYEEEQKARFPEDGNSPYVFPFEQRFPVLMVSVVGPQHGRIFFACMDGRDVVIRQSQLYSFEKREAAP
ncbi:hypothetical protein PISL3812_02552 [Talaromyces islandicus]|uniref:Uncharacterized protein n=1 Tax=Talaromyces islandicus TaxID=28573 RepID=A0A0U1LQ76_TALIS|nr:hypothetical protein PISL3812_02552 [Talaromyces islandicus]